MARNWQSLRADDPAFRLHQILHESIEIWLENARKNTDLYALAASLEPSLHPERARALSISISRKMGERITPIVRSACEVVYDLEGLK